MIGRFSRSMAQLRSVVLSACVGVALAGWSTPAAAQPRAVLIFAAASLKNALDEIASRYRQETGNQLVVSYAASSALARQIEAGAPADIFISADRDWIDYLAERKLVRTETQTNLVGNRLVLVAPKDRAVRLTLVPGFPLLEALDGGRLAMADVSSVPAGKYGRAALQELGVWSSVERRLAQSENVRAALLLVSRGEAPLGVVYQTDAAAEPNVKIVGVFPLNTHPPIVYPAALTTGSTNPAATRALAYLSSATARPSFEKQGFSTAD